MAKFKATVWAEKSGLVIIEAKNKEEAEEKILEEDFTFADVQHGDINILDSIEHVN